MALVRKPTTRQIAAYEMRRNGRTWNEIGESLGCSPQSARAHVMGAERRGMPALPKGQNATMKVLNPGAAVALLGAAIEGDGTTLDIPRLRQFAEAAGMPARLVNGLINRIQQKYSPVLRSLKAYTVEQRARAIEEKADMALEYIDDTAYASAGLKDLAATFGILIDKAQLLRGQPTAIFDVNHRKRIEELLPQLHAEAKRRGLTIEGEFHVAGREQTGGKSALPGTNDSLEHAEPAGDDHHD